MALLQQLGSELLTARKLVQSIRIAFRSYQADSHASIAQVRKDQQELPQIIASAERGLVEVTGLASTTQQSLQALQLEIQQLAVQLAATGDTRVGALAAAGNAVQGQLGEFTRQVSDALRDVEERSVRLRQASSELVLAAREEGERQSSEYKVASTLLTEADSILGSTFQTSHFDQLAASAKALSLRLQVLTEETLPQEIGKVSAHLTSVHGPAVQANYASATQVLGARHVDFQQQGLGASQQLTQALTGQMNLNQQAVARDLPEQVNAAAAKADQAAQQLSKESDVTKRTAANTATHLKDAQDRYFEAVQALHTELQRMMGGKR